MDNKRERIISRIPGEPPRLIKESQGYIENLSKLTDIQLKDCLARQKKLLSNKFFIQKLPDKGKKINDSKNRLEKELAHRDILKQTCNLFSDLKIDDPNKLEWDIKVNEEEDLDSDDLSEEENNSFRILATQGGPNKHKKLIRKEKPEQPLIKKEDLIDSNTVIYEKHVEIVCKKAEEGRSHVKERFKPFKTLKSTKNCENIKKEKPKNWEVTAATPPDPIYGDTKIISLQESLKLEKEHTIRFKELQEKYAAQRLAEKMGIKIPDFNFKFTQNGESLTKYREEIKESDSEKESDEEILEDEDEEPERDVATIYNLID